MQMCKCIKTCLLQSLVLNFDEDGITQVAHESTPEATERIEENCNVREHKLRFAQSVNSTLVGKRCAGGNDLCAKQTNQTDDNANPQIQAT